MHKEVSSITDNVGCNKFNIAMWMENIDELPGSTDLHTKNLDSPISIPSSPEIEPPSKSNCVCKFFNLTEKNDLL